MALDNAVEETAASATGGVAAALAESALLCHVEHAVLVETEQCLESKYRDVDIDLDLDDITTVYEFIHLFIFG